MRRDLSKTIPLLSKVLFSALWGGLCAAQIAAPLLAQLGDRSSASLLYSLFSPVCHQDPGRSFSICGYSLAVCHRCAGIYWGLLLGVWFPFALIGVLESPLRRRAWVLCAAAPMLLDAGLQFTGWWGATAVTRAITGFVFGALLSSLLVPAFTEILHVHSWKRRPADSKA